MGKKFTVKCNSCGREIKDQKIYAKWTPKHGLTVKISIECECGNTGTYERFEIDKQNTRKESVENERSECM